MNSFANSILSFLLSWIRTLAANLWGMVNSEDGGALYQFLASNWLWILLVLCTGGWIADRIIYFFRWRPHYVWLSRLDHKRRKRVQKKSSTQPDASHADDPAAAFAFSRTDQPVNLSAAGAQSGYAPAPTQPVHTFAPTMQYAPQPAEHTRRYEPQAADWKLEDSAVRWDEAEPAFETPAYEPQPPSQSSMAYYRDVQAGFAPAVSPEQLYAPRRRTAPDPAAASVHPGLNEDIFRQNIGLETQGEVPDLRAPVVQAPVFRPFTAVQTETEPVKTPGAFSRLARRARDLVGIADEENVPTIRDLQSNVDVSNAFHEPVYPQQAKDTDNLSF